MNCSGFSTVFVVSGGIRIQAQPGGPASGDLTGSYDGVLGPIVHRIQSQSVDPRTPNNGDTFVFNGGEWIPTPTPTNTATVFRGIWDANTNTPDISISPSDGDTWIVYVAGNTNIGGITEWNVGDYAVYSGGNWYKLSSNSFGWLLTGNGGTNPTVNYIGTSDQHDLSLRANAQEVLRLRWTDLGALFASNVTGSNFKLLGDIAVNGGNVTTTSGIVNLFNTTATEIDFAGGASTLLKMGNAAGHTVISGSVKIPNGLSGSLTQLTDGSSYLREGLGALIQSGTDGHVTIGVKDSVFATISGSTFTGPVVFNVGLSGSLTRLSDGSSYLREGLGTLIESGTDGHITIGVKDSVVATISGSTFTGPVVFNAGLSGSLTRLSDGSSYLREGLGVLIQSGTGGHITVGVKDSVFATISGSTFTGPVLFNAGLSGSLTTLVDGTPYLKSGVNVVISTASNGSITVAATAAGTDTQVQFNDGGTLFGATAGFTFDKSTSNVLIGGDLAVNGGDITTTQSTATVFDANATTVNIGAAATAMNVGNAAGTVTLRGDLAVNGGDITTNQTTATVFNTTATTVNIAGGATTGVNIGNAVGTISLAGPTTIAGTTSLLNAAALRFYEPAGSGVNFTSFQAQAQAGDVTYTLPAADGTANQYLSTNGTGLLSWANISSQAWSITGNNNVTAAVNFIGSINNQDVVMRASNTEKLRLSANVGTAISVNGSSTFNSWLLLATQAGVAQELRLQGTANGYTALKAGAQGNTNITYTLPISQGTGYLTNDGGGTLSWFNATNTGVNFNVTTTQIAPLGTSQLFNVSYDSAGTGNAPGAFISSISKGNGSTATGLTVEVDCSSNSGIIEGIVVDATSANAGTNSTGIDITTSATGNATTRAINAAVSTTSNNTTIEGLNLSCSSTGTGDTKGIVVSATTSGGANPAIVVGTAGTASGYVQYLSTSTVNNAGNNYNALAGFSTYIFTGAAFTGLTLPGVASVGKTLFVINTTAGAITVNIAGGTFTINQNRASMFISNGTNWFPVQN